MSVFFYTSSNDENSQKLLALLQSHFCCKSIVECNELSKLSELFAQPAPLQDIVILVAASKEELKVFARYTPRLDQRFFILVLSAVDQETIALGHLLRPRFMTYHDSDFNDISSVLAKVLLKNTAEQNITDFSGSSTEGSEITCREM